METFDIKCGCGAKLAEIRAKSPPTPGRHGVCRACAANHINLPVPADQLAAARDAFRASLNGQPLPRPQYRRQESK